MYMWKELYIVLHALAVQVEYGRTYPNGVTYAYPVSKVSAKRLINRGRLI